MIPILFFQSYKVSSKLLLTFALLLGCPIWHTDSISQRKSLCELLNCRCISFILCSLLVVWMNLTLWHIQATPSATPSVSPTKTPSSHPTSSPSTKVSSIATFCFHNHFLNFPSGAHRWSHCKYYILPISFQLKLYLILFGFLGIGNSYKAAYLAKTLHTVSNNSKCFSQTQHGKDFVHSHQSSQLFFRYNMTQQLNSLRWDTHVDSMNVCLYF